MSPENMIKPQDKVMGFAYQLLGFSLIYLWHTLSNHTVGTLYDIPVFFVLVIGVFIIVYGSSKFMIDYEDVKQKKKTRNKNERQLES